MTEAKPISDELLAGYQESVTLEAECLHEEALELREALTRRYLDTDLPNLTGGQTSAR